jgi:ubiquinone/menaquinone biosynthesis C-methylase UbiE
MRPSDFSTIAEAFSRTAARYDAFAEDHPHLTRVRHKVYAHIERFVPKGAHILELNAGSGIDAIELARRGYYVHATDIASGMLARLRDKVNAFGLNGSITIQECSFTNLEHIHGKPYDVVFSNLGGLNCLADLRPVIEQLPSVLRKGGIVSWTLMPRLCLWELAEILRGRPRLAFRRLAHQGTWARLEGLTFRVYYFTPRQVIEWFGPDYEVLALQGLAVFTPTLESKNFAKRHPHLYRALAWLEDRVASSPPWWGWGDFFILTMRFCP